MKKTSKFSKIFIRIFICVCLILTARVFLSQYLIYSELRSAEQSLSYQIENERIRQEQLELQIENSLSDEYIEKIAREQLGFIKSHEILFIDSN